MVTRIAWGVVLTVVSMAASADVYRWVDTQGRVHYSDLPDAPNAVRVSVVSTPSDSAAIAQRMQAESDQRAKAAAQDQKQHSAQATEQAVQQDVAKSRAEQCKEAKERYRVAIDSQKLYRIGKDGEREYLTSQEMDEARINSRKDMDTVCSEAGS